MSTRFLFALAISCSVPLLYGQGGPCRNYAADQHNGRAGFYLDFENRAASGDPLCRLGNLSLIFGTGNGNSFVFLRQNGGWELNKEYVAIATAADGISTLVLNGTTLDSAPATLNPQSGLVAGNVIPSFADSAAEYVVVVEDIQLKAGKRKPLGISFAQEASRPLPLFNFDPSGPRQANFDLEPGEALSVTARFRIIATPSITDYAPYVDRYGQSKYGDWPGKFKSDDQFAQSAQYEQERIRRWGDPKQFDPFGGYLKSSWKEEGTGFYRVTQKNGFWWLLSPLGNPCFYTSFDSAPAPTLSFTPVSGRENLFEELPPKDGEFAEAWRVGVNGDPGVSYFVFSTANLIRKYGAGWRESLNEITKQRALAWGFSGLGKFSDPVGLSYIPRLSRKSLSNVPGAKRPDIFDPQVQAVFRNTVASQMEGRTNEPLIVGWSLGNEAEETVAASEITGVFSKNGSEVPIKRALADAAVKQIYDGDLQKLASAWKITASSIDDVYASKTAVLPAADVETLRLFFEEIYFKFVYSTVKDIDPQHLYFGSFIQIGGFTTLDDWKLLGQNVDVIGYDRYAYGLTDDRVNEYLQSTNKAAFLGEFSFSPTYHMRRGFGAAPNAPSEDETQAAVYYAQTVNEAATNPYIVGSSWFAYRDQAITGRGPGSGPELTYGEHTARGLIDVTDTPKWSMLEIVRKINLGIARKRLANTLR